MKCKIGKLRYARGIPKLPGEDKYSCIVIQGPSEGFQGRISILASFVTVPKERVGDSSL